MGTQRMERQDESTRGTSDILADAYRTDLLTHIQALGNHRASLALLCQVAVYCRQHVPPGPLPPPAKGLHLVRSGEPAPVPRPGPARRG